MNKYGYKEIRTLSSESLRSLCCQQVWYTEGNCEEYDNLLIGCNDKANITTDDIVELATEIVSHSDMENQSFLSVCFAIAKACTVTFEEI